MRYTDISDAVLDSIKAGQISSASLPVYLFLKFNSNPSQREISEGLNISVPSVQRHISDLKKAGWLKISRANELFGQNLYIIFDEPIPVE